MHPATELKAIQRWIHERILSEFPVHQAAGAYRRGKGLLHHVSHHKGRRYLLRMDFEDFFPSLTASDIELHLRNHSDCLPCGWADRDTQILLNLVCLRGRLTIGAVTSPSLSNTLCFQMDTLISERCLAWKSSMALRMTIAMNFVIAESLSGPGVNSVKSGDSIDLPYRFGSKTLHCGLTQTVAV